VAIEGVDGCGKTTQAKMLVDRLKKSEYETMYIRPVYLLLDSIRLRTPEKKKWASPRRAKVSAVTNKNKTKKSVIIRRALMCLLGYPYALAIYIFMKLISRNNIIVCDRYFYQFFFDLYGQFCEKVLIFFPLPDITFFLDVDLDLFHSRMDNSFDASVDRVYYTNVIILYRKIAQKYGFNQIDANLDMKAINDVMFTHVTKELNRGGRYD
jgi:thymidylate kinase